MGTEVAEPELQQDRLVAELTELRGLVGLLKEQVLGEQVAKNKALHELEITRKAWRSTHKTKEALSELSQLSQAEGDAVLLHCARREAVEQELLDVLEQKRQLLQHVQNLIALVDRDGGQRQDEDPSIEVSVNRADLEISKLLVRSDELKQIEKNTKLPDVHVFLGPDCIRCGAFGPTSEAEPCIVKWGTKEGALKIVRAVLPALSDEERVKLFYEIEQGYCGACGRRLKSNDDFCHCENDE